jgi:hypothetical protein
MKSMSPHWEKSISKESCLVARLRVDEADLAVLLAAGSAKMMPEDLCVDILNKYNKINELSGV